MSVHGHGFVDLSRRIVPEGRSAALTDIVVEPQPILGPLGPRLGCAGLLRAVGRPLDMLRTTPGAALVGGWTGR